MYELVLVRTDHESPLWDFEVENRAYFAQSISDRGDDYFQNFGDEHAALLAEQAKGNVAFHVLIDDQGAVVGRFNLYELTDGSADVGYRVAERVTGRGVASAALRQLCRVARDEYGLGILRAATSTENVASQRVLERAGFAVIGVTEVAGHSGIQYELELTSKERP